MLMLMDHSNYAYNAAVDSVAEGFLVWWYGIQTKYKRSCANFVILNEWHGTIMNRHYMRQQITSTFTVTEILLFWKKK